MDWEWGRWQGTNMSIMMWKITMTSISLSFNSTKLLWILSWIVSNCSSILVSRSSKITMFLNRFREREVSRQMLFVKEKLFSLSTTTWAIRSKELILTKLLNTSLKTIRKEECSQSESISLRHITRRHPSKINLFWRLSLELKRDWFREKKSKRKFLDIWFHSFVDLLLLWVKLRSHCSRNMKVSINSMTNWKYFLKREEKRKMSWRKISMILRRGFSKFKIQQQLMDIRWEMSNTLLSLTLAFLQTMVILALVFIMIQKNQRSSKQDTSEIQWNWRAKTGYLFTHNLMMREILTMVWRTWKNLQMFMGLMWIIRNYWS